MSSRCCETHGVPPCPGTRYLQCGSLLFNAGTQVTERSSCCSCGSAGLSKELTVYCTSSSPLPTTLACNTTRNVPVSSVVIAYVGIVAVRFKYAVRWRSYYEHRVRHEDTAKRTILILRSVACPGYVVCHNVRSHARFHKGPLNLGTDDISLQLLLHTPINSCEIPTNGLPELVHDCVRNVDNRSE